MVTDFADDKSDIVLKANPAHIKEDLSCSERVFADITEKMVPVKNSELTKNSCITLTVRVCV